MTSHAEGVRSRTAAPPWPNSAMADLYAHALTASTQAAAACGELSEIFDLRGEEAAARMFRQLGLSEAERAAELIRRMAGRPLAHVPSWQHYSWLYRDSPNQGARKLIAGLMTVPAALRIALEVGSRAKGLYEQFGANADHAEVRAQAQELSEEQSRQLRQVASALANTAPPPEADELLYAMP
ncbi:MAG TPA: hypothetical protein VF816_14415 [Rhodocyclaceae bacterium]